MFKITGISTGDAQDDDLHTIVVTSPARPPTNSIDGALATELRIAAIGPP